MERKACWYSVIRYAPDEIAGEVLNVGIIVHSIDDQIVTKFYLLEESSPKVRSILNSRTEELTYKSFKDIYEYYLSESPKDIHGNVGSFNISTAYSDNYLSSMYEYFKDKKMSISEPTFSLSSDTDGLFKSLFNTYVGEKYLPLSEGKEKNVKSIARKIFEERHFLNTKVKQDIGIVPVPELPVKINIDFGFKNGVWNYMQAIPNITNSSKGTEWFAKTKLLIENVSDNAKIYLMYRKSVLSEKKEILKMVNYFNRENELVSGMDLDDAEYVQHICSRIEREAHDLVEVS